MSRSGTSPDVPPGGEPGGGYARELRLGFHHELDEVHALIVRLGAHVTESLPRATLVLLDGDLATGESIVAADVEVNRLAFEVEERCLRLLTLQQPMARDMRAIVAAVRIASETERSADLIVNIVKAARRLYGSPIPPRLRGLIEQMSEQAVTLYCRALDAYVDNDAALAAALDDMDGNLDATHGSYIETIFQSHQAGSLDLQAAIQLAMVGRFYERIGDHAVNVGERVYYIVTGQLGERLGRGLEAGEHEVESTPGAGAGEAGEPGAPSGTPGSGP